MSNENPPPFAHGAQFPPGMGPQFAGQPAPAKKKRRWPWIVLAVAVVIIALLAIFGATSSTRDSANQSDTAVKACQDTVTDRLSAPSSAKFSDKYTVTDDAEGTWTVTGSVESQNALGVMLRADYSCNVRHEGGTKYSVSVDSLTQ
ncbi:hypothetical protein QNA23_10990 [Rhodococcus erythropolis]|uniref:hypothetical protein n=1 Tax=Rhodococcus erythropolis TaxID=1833 RepID=UPI0024BAD1FD|nr:hypothetical protein [Rhodococcus erythropolis]MDJ0404008.1 hypothetical protein [Rhodococcus erythropolis]